MRRKRAQEIVFNEEKRESLIGEYEPWEKEAKRLLEQFAKRYGDIRFCTIFSYCHLHLRGPNLTLYFHNDFVMQRFIDDRNLDSFKAYCASRYNLKVKLVSKEVIAGIEKELG